MAKAQVEANIQTFLRIRPSKKPSGYVEDIDGQSIKFNLPDMRVDGQVNNSKLQHTFHFNGTIDMSATQEEVFNKVGAPAVQNALEGFNSTIFAYGQTGSGKTFTLTGGPERYVDRGIIPRSISKIYNEFRTRTDMQYKAYVSYLELYNEVGYDLLDPSHETKALEDLPKVKMLEDEHGNFHLTNLSMHAADSEEDALNLLFLGDTNRAIAETPMNMASSRSHCIFTISIEARVGGTDTIRRSKLHLVDLAGSERVKKTNSTGSVLNEAKYINTSLFYLEMVIVALYEKATKGRAHIPYRNSSMTSVLRDSLGGNCKTVMIATINPESVHTEESLSTCKFAQRVSLIKNRAIVNEEADPNLVIKRLKGEILGLREEVAYLKGEAGEGEALSPIALEELTQGCRAYCNDPDPHAVLQVGALSLTKIKDAFAIFKNLVLEARAKGGSREEGGGRNGDNQALGEEAQLLGQQVEDLKACLLQRDNEIAILVNMVKKGKTADDVGLASRGASRSDAADQRNVMSAAQKAKQLQEQEQRQRDEEERRDLEAAQKSFEFNAKRADSAAVAATAGDRGDRERDSRSGALVPQQPKLTEYEQFQKREKEREKEKNELLIKRHLFGVPPPADRAIFDDAAKSFEWFQERCSLRGSVEENRDILRDKIGEAKTVGERANASRSAINYLKNSIEAIRRERALQRLDGSDSKSGEEGSDETPEEQSHRRAIEQEKVVYKESFERLRVLKPEIEHVRKILEKSRGTLQAQFDQWYNNLHARGIDAFDASLADEVADATSAVPAPTVRGKGGLQHAQSSHFSTSADAKDVSVDDDITAFYQAKDELLKRRSNR
jgi:kinesin family protein 6/9